MQTPLEAFVVWFDAVPRPVREMLAHIFQISTTEDTSLMAASRAQSLENFRLWIIRQDFPMRIAARMFHVRSIFDMVIFHHHEIDPEQGVAILDRAGNDKIIDIAPRHWEKVFNTWKDLRGEELSGTYIHSWTSWMIKLQMETV